MTLDSQLGLTCSDSIQLYTSSSLCSHAQDVTCLSVVALWDVLVTACQVLQATSAAVSQRQSWLLFLAVVFI